MNTICTPMALVTCQEIHIILISVLIKKILISQTDLPAYSQSCGSQKKLIPPHLIHIFNNGGRTNTIGFVHYMNGLIGYSQY